MTSAKARIKTPRYWSKLQPLGSNLVGARRANVLCPKGPWGRLGSAFAQGRLTWGAERRGQTMLTPNTKQKPSLCSLYTDHNRSGRAGPGCSGHAAGAGVLRDLTCLPSSAPGRPLQDAVPADATPPNAGAGASCHSRRFLPRGWVLVLRMAPSHSWSLRGGGTENKGSPDGHGLGENQYF